MASSLQIENRTDRDGVAVLSFDLPESRVNILTRAVWDDLHRALRQLRVRPGVTGLVLASAKPGIFIAGADLKFLGQVPSAYDSRVRELMEFGLHTLELLEDMPFPTCAAINGVAAGGGMEVALACDFRVTGPHANVALSLPELQLGLIPGWGGTQRLPRLCELETAVRMLYRGEMLHGEQAKLANLVQATTHGDVVEEAVKVLHSENREVPRRAKSEPLPLLDRELLKDAILAMGEAESEAQRELSSVLVRGGEQPLPDALPIETAAFCRLAGSDASKRRIAEFFASRKK